MSQTSFHRFVTSDPVHGEQSYLDSCRSFRGCCVLATQSATNIEHELAHGTSPAAAADAAMSILWTNTATKIIFRTTDPDTVRRVEALCPEVPGLVPVVRARPLSGLQPGACIASLADGRFERLPASAVRLFRGGAGPAPSARGFPRRALVARVSPFGSRAMPDARTAERPFNVLTPDACCRCADAYSTPVLRGAESRREYTISGLCQYCQDVVRIGFADGDDGAPPSHYFLRRGLVFRAQRHAR